jgi:phosphoesterase RecJ-like protein
MYKILSVPNELLDFMRDGKKFIVTGHKEPDGDCAGCALAVEEALLALGKEVILAAESPGKRVEIKEYAVRFKETVSEADREGARLIVVDCSSLDRTGDGLSVQFKGLPVIFIDHHRTAEAMGPADYLNPEAPAACCLIIQLYKSLGLAISPAAAEQLLYGLCTDTGFFRHINETQAAVFADFEALVSAGGSLKRVYARMNGGKSFNSRKLLGKILLNAECIFDGRLVISEETYEDSQNYGKESRDSDTLYQLLQSVTGVEAVCVIRQETPERCTIGFRSKDPLDVSAIASVFGGGGHKNASGATSQGQIPEVKARVLEAFRGCFS